MKRYLILILLTISIVCGSFANYDYSYAKTAYQKTGLIGGGANDLDIIDGASLNDGDFAYVMLLNNIQFTYILDADSAQTENVPLIISPNSNAGDKRWILQTPLGSGMVKETYPEWWGENTTPGTTDMTAEIQAAFTVAGTNGTITFQPKIYLISSAVTPLDGQTINLNGATIHGSGPHHLITMNGLDGVRVTNGTLDGNIANRGGVTGIYCIQGVAATNCLVDKVRFVGWGAGAGRVVTSASAVVFEANDDVGYAESSVIGACYGNVVRHCSFSDEFGSFGVRFRTDWANALTASECYDNHVHHCLFELIGKSAVEIAGHKTHSCSAEYNTVLRSDIDGMDIDKGASDCSMSFNTIRIVDESPLGGGVDQFGGITVAGTHNAANGDLYADNNRVIGNHIHTTKRVGIRIAGARNTTVQGNTIAESGIYGILLTSDGGGDIESYDNIIQGNSISGLGYFEGGVEGTVPIGIMLDAATRNIIDGNRIKGSIYRGIWSTGTDNTITNNVITGVPNAATAFGIYINADNHIVSKNRITQTGAQNNTAVIYALESDNLVITGNWIKGNTVVPYGIKTLTSGNNILVASNHISGYATDTILLAAGTGNVVDNNIDDMETLVTGDTAVSIYRGSTKLDSSGGAIAATLADGIYIGQIKTIVMTEDSTSSTVTVTHHDDVAGIPAYDGGVPTGDGEVGTFDAVDEFWALMWMGTEWTTLRATCTF